MSLCVTGNWNFNCTFNIALHYQKWHCIFLNMEEEDEEEEYYCVGDMSEEGELEDYYEEYEEYSDA